MSDEVAAMIALKNINARAGDFHLKDISFQVPTGTYAIIMGATGCGKTTLLEVICGLNKPQSGSIQMMGCDRTHAKPGSRQIGYIPQDAALFNHMTVQDNLAFALRLRKWQPADITSRVEELASLLQITPLLKRKPLGLSGGEKQRVALGRALAFRPRILCLDEPLSALDQDIRLSMCALLEQIKQDLGVTFLHVTHDRNEASRLADMTITMEKGRLVEVQG